MVTSIGSPRRTGPVALNETPVTAPADRPIGSSRATSPVAAQKTALLARMKNPGHRQNAQPRSLSASFKPVMPSFPAPLPYTPQAVSHETYEEAAHEFQASALDQKVAKRIESKEITATLKEHQGKAPSEKKVRAEPELRTAHQETQTKLEAKLKEVSAELAHLDSVHGMAEDKQRILNCTNLVLRDKNLAPVGLLRMYPSQDPQLPALDALGKPIKSTLKIESICSLPTAPGTGSALIAGALSLAQKDYGGRVWLRNQSEGEFYAKMSFGIVPDKASTEKPDRPDGLITPSGHNSFGFGENMLFDTKTPGNWQERDGSWKRVKPQPPADAATDESKA